MTHQGGLGWQFALNKPGQQRAHTGILGRGVTNRRGHASNLRVQLAGLERDEAFAPTDMLAVLNVDVCDNAGAQRLNTLYLTIRYELAVVEFSSEPFDPFFNANRPEDLEEAERMMQEPAA